MGHLLKKEMPLHVENVHRSAVVHDEYGSRPNPSMPGLLLYWCEIATIRIYGDTAMRSGRLLTLEGVGCCEGGMWWCKVSQRSD